MDYSWSQPHQCPVLGLDPEAWIQHAVRSGSVMPHHTEQDTAGAPPASSLGGIFAPDLPRQCIPTEIYICSIATLQIQDWFCHRYYQQIPAFAWMPMFKYLQFLGCVLVFNTDIYSTCLLAFSKHNIAKWFSNSLREEASSALHPLALLLCSQEDCSNSL